MGEHHDFEFHSFSGTDKKDHNYGKNFLLKYFFIFIIAVKKI